jgi:hypothetical protein
MQAIPTEYAGTRFRSRLEARWAALFDQLGWAWEYEPLDLAGYIPDFVLTFPHAPLLVEVKPVLEYPDLADFGPKIIRSGWDREAIIVGAKIWNDHTAGPTMGMLYETDRDGGWGSGWGEGEMFTCAFCCMASVYHHTGSYHCRRCGRADGDHHLGGISGIGARWREAGNVVQWRPAV